MVRQGGAQMTIWCIRIACWITKLTDTYSEFVMLLHGNDGYANAFQCYLRDTLPELL